MIRMLQGWQGAAEIDGESYSHISEYHRANSPASPVIHIKLYPAVKQAEKRANKAQPVADREVVVTVKKYMTQKATPQFDFMAKWNNDVPMPLRTMVGRRIKETPGMVYMELHGDILVEKTTICMCCGRKLTNPVSQYFGIGPECGNHNYVNPFDTEEELKEAVTSYKKKLQATTWKGWIIKSAITKEQEYGV